MVIERATAATVELQAALQRLIPQLTDRVTVPGESELLALVQGIGSILLVAREPDAGGPIVGAACLGTYRVPTGIRAVIEDLVVDSEWRGQGIGEALTRALLDLARELGAPGVALTSNSRRAEANRLYQRMGFKLRETNSYYCDLR